MVWNESSKLYSATAAVLLLIAVAGTSIALPKVQSNTANQIPVDMPVRLDRAGTYTTGFTTDSAVRYYLALGGKDYENSERMPEWKLRSGAISWAVTNSQGQPVGTMHTADIEEGTDFGEFPGVAGNRYHLTLTVQQPRPSVPKDQHLVVTADPAAVESNGVTGAFMIMSAIFTAVLSVGFLIAALVAQFKRSAVTP